MFTKICNIEDYAVYMKEVESYMTVIGFWKSKIVKVIVVVTKYDVTDQQRCLESFGSSDFEYSTINKLK